MYFLADKMKTSEEVAKEGHILREMLEIVERRDSLHTLLEAVSYTHLDVYKRQEHT